MKQLSRTQTTMSALAVAALAVVGVMLWLTSNPESSDQEGIQIVTEVTSTPEVTPNTEIAQAEQMGRISEEAASSAPLEIAAPTPAVAGVSTTAPTGPAENALAFFGFLTLIGFSSSFLLAKFA